MKGYPLKNGFIDFAKTEFNCPHCHLKYNDSDDKYLEKINNSRHGIIFIRCKCNQTFSLTYTMQGDLVSFE